MQSQGEIRTFSSFFMRLFLNDRALRYSMRRYKEPNIDDGGEEMNAEMEMEESLEWTSDGNGVEGV